MNHATRTQSDSDDCPGRSENYQLVQLANGKKTLYSASYDEKMHPGLGPAVEAELLYVRQLQIRERLTAQRGELVVWDVGLGAAANAVALLRATRDLTGHLSLVSFDYTSEPLTFALQHAAELGYLADYEDLIAQLAGEKRVQFENGGLSVLWEFHLGDFPAWLVQARAGARAVQPAGGQKDLRLPVPEGPPVRSDASPGLAAPHAIFYDAFSPAKNPAMWTLPVMEDLFHALDPAQPCALTTYSRSTMIRTTLLLAGFYVGVGHAAGMKEETTIAANIPGLIAEPLGARWLERAARSDSAEPLHLPHYSRSPIRLETMARLRKHRQFPQMSESGHIC
jgi:hypothetical protein